jgi:hypothetical protein
MITYDPFSQKLDIDFSSVATASLRLSPWHRGLSAERIEDGLAEPYDGDIGLPLALLANTSDASAPWLDAVPPEVRAAVEPFVWRQWLVLKLIQRDPRTLELIASAPLLVWLVALEVGDEAMTLDEASVLLTRRRRDILGRLGLPATESFVRLVSRIRFARYLPDACQQVRSFLRHRQLIDAAREHGGVILGEAILTFLMTPLLFELPWARLSLDFFKAGPEPLAERAKDYIRFLESTCDIAWHTARMCDYHADRRSQRLPRRMRRIRNVRDLNALHGALAEERRERQRQDLLEELRQAKHLEFPSPPFPGTDTIVPIETGEALIDEGRDMIHCVSSLAPCAAKGERYFYKVLAPERATLELRLVPGSAPRLGELKLFRNARPSPETRAEVERWVASLGPCPSRPRDGLGKAARPQPESY